MTNLPDKPWSVGDTFETERGLTYTFDGVRWLSDGELALSGGNEYVKANADTTLKNTIENPFISLTASRPRAEDGTWSEEAFGLEVDIDAGNTWKNQFVVGNRNGYAIKVLGGGGRQVWFGGKLTQKGDSLENDDDHDYIIRKNLNDAIADKSDKDHTHESQDLTHNHDADYAGKAEFDAHTHPEPPPGRPFKFGAATKKGEFFADARGLFCNIEDLNGNIRVHSQGGDFTWSTAPKITIWDTNGVLKWAGEAGKATDWKGDSLAFGSGTEKYNKGLSNGVIYYVSVEGYW